MLAAAFALTLIFYSLSSPNTLYSEGNIDGAIYSNSVVEFRPGWADGKPAYILVGRLFYMLGLQFGLDRAGMVTVFTFISNLFGALACVNVYLIFRILYSRRFYGFFAFLLAAAAPAFVKNSIIVEVYALNIFFVTFSVLMWLRGRYLLWGLGWGLALTSHLSAVLLAPLFLYSFFCVGERRKVCAGLLVAACVSAAGYLWVLSFYPGLREYIMFYVEVAGRDYLGGFGVLGLGYRLYVLLSAFGFVLVVLSVLSLGGLTDRRSRVPLLWGVPYLLFFFLWIQDGGSFYAYATVPAAILAAGGLMKFFEETRAYRVCVLVFAVLAGASLYQAAGVAEEVNESAGEWDEVALSLADKLPKGSLLIAGWEGPFIDYYTDDVLVASWAGSDFPSDKDDITSLVENTVEGHLTYGGRVFVSGLCINQSRRPYYEGDVRFTAASNILNDRYHIIEYDKQKTLYEVKKR